MVLDAAGSWPQLVIDERFATNLSSYAMDS